MIKNACEFADDAGFISESIYLSEAAVAEAPWRFVYLLDTFEEIYVPPMLVLCNPPLEDASCDFYQSLFNINGSGLIFLYAVLH